jgi:hypothetical protein
MLPGVLLMHGRMVQHLHSRHAVFDSDQIALAEASVVGSNY